MLKKYINSVSFIGLLAILIFVFLSISGIFFLDSTERNLYEMAMKMTRAYRGQDSRVVCIEVDKRSLEELGPWPWPRGVFAEMISRLDAYDVKVIGLNIPLSEKTIDRGLGHIRKFREKLETYAQGEKEVSFKTWILENLSVMENDLDDDGRLVAGVEASGHVILMASGSVDNKLKGEKEIDAVFYKNSLARRDIPASLIERHATVELVPPFAELSRVAQGLGHGNLLSKEKKAWLSHPLYVNYRGTLVPSLPLQMAIAHFQKQPGQVLVDEKKIRLGDFNIPLWKGEMPLILPDREGAFPRLSFVDVLRDKTPLQVLKGKTVILGVGAWYSDAFMPPPPGMSGTAFGAYVLNNILNQNLVSRPQWMPFLEIMFLVLVGCFAATYYPNASPLKRAVWTGALGILILLCGMMSLSVGHIWVRVIYVCACLVSIYLIASLTDLFRSGRMAKESIETNRLLGLSFQSQGLLDLAFEKFQKLPLDLETKDLIYNLGMEFERKRMINKALASYAYIAKAGPFRDVEDRIPRLRESEKSSTIGSHEGITETSVLADSGNEIRSKVGRYEIIEELGKGAMGLVYKALDPKINRLLAIKTIRFSDEFDEDVIQEIKDRFFRESEIAGQLSHPSIVTIYDAGEDGDLTYMVMEYLEGDDLEKFISKRRLLPFRRTLDVVASVADALEYAHRAEVIHRDIKPANIMLLKSGGVKVTDFGIAKAISSSRTKTGVILGTPNYMSPEQIMGQKIDHRSDIFSLGVLFFQLLTGETPFHGDNLSSLLYQITQVKHPPVRDYNPKIPRVCEQIIDKALAKNPKERFRSAGDLAKYTRLLASKIDHLVRKRQA